MDTTRHRLPLLSRSAAHLNRGAADRRRLRFESLEDRRMLATFAVSNNLDAGAGSMRDAIDLANGSVGTDTITFSSLFDTQQTIHLDSQLPTITDGLTISGPGQELLALDAGNGADNFNATGDGYRIFEINNANSGDEIDVLLSGLKLTGGDVAADGGAILNHFERRTRMNDEPVYRSQFEKP